MKYVKEKKLYYLENNKEHLFVPVKKLEGDDPLSMSEPYIFEELPDKIYGKFLHNYQGYNPAGWWRYKFVNKCSLKEK